MHLQCACAHSHERAWMSMHACEYERQRGMGWSRKGVWETDFLSSRKSNTRADSVCECLQASTDLLFHDSTGEQKNVPSPSLCSFHSIQTEVYRSNLASIQASHSSMNASWAIPRFQNEAHFRYCKMFQKNRHWVTARKKEFTNMSKKRRMPIKSGKPETLISSGIMSPLVEAKILCMRSASHTSKIIQ